ncbi:MAG: menaquinone biosynthesis protein [Trueperaceae bacterium]
MAERSTPATSSYAAEAAGGRIERLGIVSYANVAPLHYGLEPWGSTSAGVDRGGVEFVRGVPSELNDCLLAGEIDLTLISSIEFLRHRRRLRALPDFSIATLGPVYSVMLFHWRPWDELAGARVAVSNESATSVELLRVLLAADGLEAELVPVPPELGAMLTGHDAALLIGDAALSEGVAGRTIGGRQPLVTDLGEAWYGLTRLPFTFAVWASLSNRPPSPGLVARLREARERGLGELASVARAEGERRGIAQPVMQRYLNNFRYYLETPDRDGLLEFGRRSLGELAAGELEYWQR